MLNRQYAIPFCLVWIKKRLENSDVLGTLQKFGRYSSFTITYVTHFQYSNFYHPRCGFCENKN